VRLLPATLPASDLPAPAEDGHTLRLPIGLEENTLSPVWHDFAEAPHLLVVGDTECGKTNLLRVIAKGITDHYTPEQARIMTVDYRRELVETVPEEYRLGHAVSADALKEFVDGAARAIRQRVPGEDVSPARMRLCDWWQGPRLFILVDDYDMIGSGPANQPFAPLYDHLALGHEVGLHVIVARSAAGAGRGLNDPLLRRMQEVNTPALLMSCPPSEGYLFGNVKGRELIPGRALRIVRRKSLQIQTPLLEGSR
jgi:S-DNA-T family DNA segregation ATPase FtsK/SpoIIIE